MFAKTVRFKFAFAAMCFMATSVAWSQRPETPVVPGQDVTVPGPVETPVDVPAGVDLPSGVDLASGVDLPTGVDVPADVNVPVVDVPALDPTDMPDMLDIQAPSDSDSPVSSGDPVNTPTSDPTTSDPTADDSPADDTNDPAAGESVGGAGEFDVQMRSGGCFFFFLFGSSTSQDATFRFSDAGDAGNGDMEIDIMGDEVAEMLDGSRNEVEFFFARIWYGLAESETSTLVSFGLRSDNYLFGRAFGFGDLQGRYQLTGEVITDAGIPATGSETQPADDPNGQVTDTPAAGDQNLPPGGDLTTVDNTDTTIAPQSRRSKIRN